MPGHHGHIAFLDLAGFKQAAQAALRLDATRHEQQARSVLVEPVHDQGFRVNGLHAFGQAVLLVGAAAGHRQQAAGLFKHQQVLVFMDRCHRKFKRPVTQAIKLEEVRRV